VGFWVETVVERMSNLTDEIEIALEMSVRTLRLGAGSGLKMILAGAGFTAK
jgi:hypothetical protein